MIFFYVLFGIVGLAVFFLTTKLPLSARIALAVGVFLVLSIAASLWVAKVGDKALPGAVTIYP